MTWRRAKVAPERTHHVLEGVPLYQERFDEVLKFHAPGLAPVCRGGQAWHIHPDGSPAYARRFARTFGFYEDRAAVVAAEGWHHIRLDGTDLYAERYAWCGNYQEARCTVRGQDEEYLHLDPSGRPAYTARWRYAGDFRDGIAVVQGPDGRSTHIDPRGELTHGRWFSDLDVFHKSFARARDTRGWTHVDRRGIPVYGRRFAAVEPFYNGQARVERFDGGLEVIDEAGTTRCELRREAPGVPYRAGALGRWTVGDEVSRGSNGAIYECPPGALIKSTSNLSAWAREVELLRLLGGRGAPALVDAFTRSTTGYLVLERVHGEPLGARNATRPRTIDEALRLVRGLLRTLGRLHEAGWAHTDVHPENVLDSGGEAVLLDPAYAVRLDGSGRWSGEVHWGRWEFVPPEQFEGFTTLDKSADTYAVCGLLAYLVTGLGPFPVAVPRRRSPDWRSVRAAFLKARRAPSLTALPGSLRGLVSQGLSYEPDRRFRDARALLSAIERRMIDV